MVAEICQHIELIQGGKYEKDRLTPLNLEMKTEIRVSLSGCSQNIRKQKVLFKIIQEDLTFKKFSGTIAYNRTK